MQECLGGNITTVAAGYWRINNFTDNIIECFKFENCLSSTDNFTCFQGHIGPLCDTCDYKKEKWNSHYVDFVNK